MAQLESVPSDLYQLQETESDDPDMLEFLFAAEDSRDYRSSIRAQDLIDFYPEDLDEDDEYITYHPGPEYNVYPNTNQGIANSQGNPESGALGAVLPGSSGNVPGGSEASITGKTPPPVASWLSHDKWNSNSFHEEFITPKHSPFSTLFAGAPPHTSSTGRKKSSATSTTSRIGSTTSLIGSTTFSAESTISSARNTTSRTRSTTSRTGSTTSSAKSTISSARSTTSATGSTTSRIATTTRPTSSETTYTTSSHRRTSATTPSPTVSAPTPTPSTDQQRADEGEEPPPEKPPPAVPDPAGAAGGAAAGAAGVGGLFGDLGSLGGAVAGGAIVGGAAAGLAGHGGGHGGGSTTARPSTLTTPLQASVSTPVVLPSTISHSLAAPLTSSRVPISSISPVRAPSSHTSAFPSTSLAAHPTPSGTLVLPANMHPSHTSPSPFATATSNPPLPRCGTSSPWPPSTLASVGPNASISIACSSAVDAAAFGALINVINADVQMGLLPPFKVPWIYAQEVQGVRWNYTAVEPDNGQVVFKGVVDYFNYLKYAGWANVGSGWVTMMSSQGGVGAVAKRVAGVQICEDGKECVGMFG
ncbi:hypothetical protein MMC11_000062 [Xylographa trunciseda]|nr:hypothetical protein [Xylographa trunciseda]